MTITAKVIAHSVAADAPDLITLQLRYPRFIHAEFMTHRVFSRNASSSRAVPVKRMIQDVIDDPAMPVAWGSNKPGMQAGEECTNLIEAWIGDAFYKLPAHAAWLEAREAAVDIAKGFADAGYHKQIVNRLLEPFGHISVVVTATEWDNFFDLRCHPDSDPTMRALAEAIRDAMPASEPRYLKRGWWHFPYVSEDEWDAVRDTIRPDHGGFAPDSYVMERLAMVSAARCARVSYLNHDGSQPDIEKDLDLAQKLLESKHMSPFEHQAQAPDPNAPDYGTQHWGNFTHWNQFRKMIEAAQ